MSNKNLALPTRQLVSKYKAIFTTAWTNHEELAGSARLADETAFLPAALSLQDTPVHPAPRRFALAIMTLFVIALVWAIFGKVDIVAIAPGRIIVSDRTKLIQPLEASVVRKVLVKDGDRVQAGQVLVELDTTIASADKASVQEQLNTAASEVYRTQVLQQLLSNSAQKDKVPEMDVLNAKTIQSQLQSQLQSEWRDISARLAKLDAEATRRKAEIQTVMAAIAKL